MTDPDVRATEVHPVTGLTGGLQARHEAALPGEGLRERKKRLTRQQISDTATGMFLQHGFDEVRVADVAAACGVSEKTVYNYFPTKESLLLDREEGMAEQIRRSLGPDAPPGSPVDAMVSAIETELQIQFAEWDDEGEYDAGMIGRFRELIEGSPSLRAAQVDMMERLARVAAEAMADRAGMDPDDPEPQIAADAIMGLYRVQYLAMHKYAASRNGVEMGGAVMGDVRRAARLIDTGLWSFGLAVQGASGRDQLKAAADATNEARKQVVSAIKQARDAWQVVIDEAKARNAATGAAGPFPPAPNGGPGGGFAGAREARRQRSQTQRELMRAGHDVQRAHRAEQQALREEAKALRERQKAIREQQKADREVLKGEREQAKNARERAKAERERATGELERLEGQAEKARAKAAGDRARADALREKAAAKAAAHRARTDAIAAADGDRKRPRR